MPIPGKFRDFQNCPINPSTFEIIITKMEFYWTTQSNGTRSFVQRRQIRLKPAVYRINLLRWYRNYVNNSPKNGRLAWCCQYNSQSVEVHHRVLFTVKYSLSAFWWFSVSAEVPRYCWLAPPTASNGTVPLHTEGGANATHAAVPLLSELRDFCGTLLFSLPSEVFFLIFRTKPNQPA